MAYVDVNVESTLVVLLIVLDMMSPSIPLQGYGLILLLLPQ